MYNYFKSKLISGLTAITPHRDFILWSLVQVGGQVVLRLLNSEIIDFGIGFICMNIMNIKYVQGEFDKISDGESIVICNEPGSNRRCGGQGDLLTGMIATFLHFGMKQKIDSAPVLAAYTASKVKS